MSSADSSRHRLRRRLRALAANRSSGAVDLALEAIVIAQEWNSASLPAAELAAELAGMHPAIAAVANVGRLIQRETRKTDDPPGRLARLERSLREGNRLIAEKVGTLIASTASVITISNSSTVREALITAGVRRVYVLESLPGGEGRSMAEALQAKLSDSPGAEKRVRLIPDAAMANVVPLVDCALVGVDSFDRRGSILHKVGTLPLALCCRHFGKPFHAAGHSFKLVEGELGAAAEGDALPEESWFDLTPAEMITRLITEE